MIVQVRVTLETVVSDWHFDNLSGSHFQSHSLNSADNFRSGSLNASHQQNSFQNYPHQDDHTIRITIFRARPIHSANPRQRPPSWKILNPPLYFIQRPARYCYFLNGILLSSQGNTVFIKEKIPALKIWHLDGSSGKTAIVTMKVMDFVLMAITGNTQRFTSVVEQTEIKTFLSSFLLIFHSFCWLTSQPNARWLSGQWLV